MKKEKKKNILFEKFPFNFTESRVPLIPFWYMKAKKNANETIPILRSATNTRYIEHIEKIKLAKISLLKQLYRNFL